MKLSYYQKLVELLSFDMLHNKNDEIWIFLNFLLRREIEVINQTMATNQSDFTEKVRQAVALQIHIPAYSKKV